MAQAQKFLKGLGSGLRLRLDPSLSRQRKSNQEPTIVLQTSHLLSFLVSWQLHTLYSISIYISIYWFFSIHITVKPKKVIDRIKKCYFHLKQISRQVIRQPFQFEFNSFRKDNLSIKQKNFCLELQKIPPAYN